MLDFASVIARQKSLSDVVEGVPASDLPALTTEIYDAFESRLDRPHRL